MNNLSRTHNTEVLSDRFALKVVSHLASGASEVPHDISERLRVARLQALSARKIVKTQTAATTNGQGGTATMTWGGSEPSNGWTRFAVFAPLALVVMGLLFINSVQSDMRAEELADVDVALLTDALPPAAFSDPGFVQFLRTTP